MEVMMFGACLQGNLSEIERLIASQPSLVDCLLDEVCFYLCLFVCLFVCSFVCLFVAY